MTSAVSAFVNAVRSSGIGPTISSADQKFSPRQYSCHAISLSASMTRTGGRPRVPSLLFAIAAPSRARARRARA